MKKLKFLKTFECSILDFGNLVLGQNQFIHFSYMCKDGTTYTGYIVVVKINDSDVVGNIIGNFR